jgi:hypothetical protein
MQKERKDRINLYITERQKQRLEVLSQEENLPVSEIIRRSIDIYLAWNDKTYEDYATELRPTTKPSTPPQKERPFYPQP